NTLVNEEMSANAARAKTWDEFYEAMGGTFTDLANYDANNYLLEMETLGIDEQKQSVKDLLKFLRDGGNAEDYEPPGKLAGIKGKKKPKFNSPFAQQAADMYSSTWEDPGISKGTENFKGGAQSKGRLNSATVGTQAQSTAPAPRPEGATLRKW